MCHVAHSVRHRSGALHAHGCAALVRPSARRSTRENARRMQRSDHRDDSPPPRAPSPRPTSWCARSRLRCPSIRWPPRTAGCTSGTLSSAGSRTSPTTNLPMGCTLVDVPHVRNVVDAIVKRRAARRRRRRVPPPYGRAERRPGHPMPLFVNGSRVRNLHLLAFVSSRTCRTERLARGSDHVVQRWMFCRGPGETSLRRYDTPLTCAMLGTSTLRACDEPHAGTGQVSKNNTTIGGHTEDRFWASLIGFDNHCKCRGRCCMGDFAKRNGRDDERGQYVACKSAGVCVR